MRRQRALEKWPRVVERLRDVVRGPRLGSQCKNYEGDYRSNNDNTTGRRNERAPRETCSSQNP